MNTAKIGLFICNIMIYEIEWIRNVYLSLSYYLEGNGDSFWPGYEKCKPVLRGSGDAYSPGYD